MMLHSSAMGLL